MMFAPFFVVLLAISIKNRGHVNDSIMTKKSSKTELPRGPGVIYARYSSHAQRDCSIEQQVEAAQAHADSCGIQIIRVYADRAVSGKTDRRPEFQKLLRDAQSGEFDYVIAWKSNRIGRNMLQAMVNEERLAEAGVKCLYVEEDFDDNAAGRFALRSMMNVNQFYIENMAEDIKRGLKDSAQQCKALAGIPFGFKKGPDGCYAIDEERAEIVREIFNRILSGESQASVMDDLNRRGIRTSRGSAWSKNGLQHLLKNEKFIGIYKWDDVVIPGGIPRIISDEVFYQVQEVLKMKPNPQHNRRRNANGEYLLTGKLFCGKCGSPMVGSCGRGKAGKNYYYYVCKKHLDEKACDLKNVRRDEIEEIVAHAIMQYALTDEVTEWIADMVVEWAARTERDAGLGIIEAEMADNKKALDNMLRAIEMGVITESTKNRLQELENEKNVLAAKAAAARAEIVTVSREEILAGLRLFRDKNPDNQTVRRTLFDTFLRAVYIYEDDLRIVFSYTGPRNTVSLDLKELAEKEPSGDDSCVLIDPLLSHSIRLIRTPSLFNHLPLFVCVVRGYRKLINE